jgi:hypothetical protein
MNVFEMVDSGVMSNEALRKVQDKIDKAEKIEEGRATIEVKVVDSIYRDFTGYQSSTTDFTTKTYTIESSTAEIADVKDIIAIATNNTIKELDLIRERRGFTLSVNAGLRVDIRCLNDKIQSMKDEINLIKAMPYRRQRLSAINKLEY